MALTIKQSQAQVNSSDWGGWWLGDGPGNSLRIICK